MEESHGRHMSDVGADSPRKKTGVIGDRFIPSRASTQLSSGLLWREPERPSPGSTTTTPAGGRDDLSKTTHNLLLRNELLGANLRQLPPSVLDSDPDRDLLVRGSLTQTGFLKYSVPQSPLKEHYSPGYSAIPEPPSPFSLSSIGSSSETMLQSPRKMPRKISKVSFVSTVPFKMLDAPELQDDFYLNLLDWSSLNVLAVGLASRVYLWSACTSQVSLLCDLKPEQSVTSVSWVQRGSHLAVGTTTGEVQIWDTQKTKLVRTFTGHSSRVGTLAWSMHNLATGSRDRSILLRDVRSPEQFQRKLLSHKQEVCGLKWSPDDQQLASGGNDNRLFVWLPSTDTPLLKFTEHEAAVKAIAWSPHQHGLLASGGGTADRCIRFWNTLTNQSLQHIDTGSQVCNLVWSKTVNELVSTHGYSQNQIVVWKYPSMVPVVTLTGHTYRVLYLAMSPDGQTIVTGAGDETLRFWTVFNKSRSNGGPRSSLDIYSQIR